MLGGTNYRVGDMLALLDCGTACSLMNPSYLPASLVCTFICHLLANLCSTYTEQVSLKSTLLLPDACLPGRLSRGLLPAKLEMSNWLRY